MFKQRVLFYDYANKTHLPTQRVYISIHNATPQIPRSHQKLITKKQPIMRYKVRLKFKTNFRKEDLTHYLLC